MRRLKETIAKGDLTMSDNLIEIKLNFTECNFLQNAIASLHGSTGVTKKLSIYDTYFTKEEIEEMRSSLKVLIERTGENAYIKIFNKIERQMK